MEKQIVSILIKLFQISLAVVLSLALVLNIVTLWAINEIERSETVNFGYFGAIVGSGSMEPTISMNDLVLIENDQSYRIEDIVTYVLPQGSLVTHRVKEVLSQGYITQGDANNVPDKEVVSHSRVLGKVVFILPGVGVIRDVISSPKGIILVVGALLLIYLINRVSSGYIEPIQEQTRDNLTESYAYNSILKKKKSISIILILCLCGFLLSSAHETFGRYLKANIAIDSAPVAKFNVKITTSEEFVLEHSESFLEYYFISDTDVKGFIFHVQNNGESDIICIPHLSDDISYRIYVSETECSEFFVGTKETVDFWLVIVPDGLNTDIKKTALYIDIKQVEGK